ncbi:serine hydrolase [Spirosoma sp. KNUC1025]|uniref:serine hydrolase domain-containing protein n=1 Tax=Spirosoma sp. KNUC1025 TaxID=2894082 RepID=UPI003870AFE3|nr:beta-lactamase family protein [Spirosoma sp. KNUC1025]
MNLNRRDFLRQLGFGAAGLTVAATLPTTGWTLPAKTSKLPRSLPEAQGVAPRGLLDFVNTIEAQKLNVHSMMVVRHGQVVAEGWWAPYAPQYKHTLYSLSKSFTSTAVGMAVAEKKLTVDDKVVSFFTKDVPATVSENLAAMSVKDLLTMSTGHDKDTTPALRGAGTDSNWVKSFLAQPVEHKPGTFFVYNSGATYMLSAIVQHLTGQTVLEYLKPRLFGPLGIEGEDWEVSPQGINTGGWGLRLRTEDIAKFGQLYLQKGIWNRKRLVAESWINDATRAEVQSKGGKGDASVNDWIQGYGYQFWRCRNDAYRGDGAFGQYCIVLPKEDAVVAITSETANMQAVLDAVWKHILPALQRVGLPAERVEQAALTKKLSTLTLLPESTQPASTVASQISGKTYTIADNPMHVKDVSLTFGKDGCIFKLQDDQGPHQVLCGVNRWAESTTTFAVAPLMLTPTPVPGDQARKVAGSGSWQDPNTFVMVWRFIETAHYDMVTCRFGSEGVQVEFQSSLSLVNKTKDKRPVLEGKMMA